MVFLKKIANVFYGYISKQYQKVYFAEPGVSVDPLFLLGHNKPQLSITEKS